MSEINQEFYIWTMYECVKTTAEWWGIDYTSCLDNVKRDFPNVFKIFEKMYGTTDQHELYEIEPKIIENPQTVGELITNMLPFIKRLRHNSTVQPQGYKYRYLHMCRCDKPVFTYRCDVLLAILLFTEDIILEEISTKRVVLNNNKIIIYGNYTTIKISKRDNVTHIGINIHGVAKIYYQIYSD